MARNLTFLGRPKYWPFHQYLAGPPATENRRIDAVPLHYGILWRFNSVNIFVAPQIPPRGLHGFPKLGWMEFDKSVILRGVRDSLGLVGW